MKIRGQNPIKGVLFDFDGTLTYPGALDFPLADVDQGAGGGARLLPMDFDELRHGAPFRFHGYRLTGEIVNRLPTGTGCGMDAGWPWRSEQERVAP